MTETNLHLNRELERRANEIIGDEVVLKLHDGHPGADCTENLVDGTGRPAVCARTGAAPIEFVATHRAGWRDYYVSIWSGDLAVSLLSSGDRPGVYNFQVAPGDRILISSFPQITVSST